MNEFKSNTESEKYEDILDLEDIKMMSEGVMPSVLDSNKKNSLKERVMNRILAPCPVGGETSYSAKQEWLRITDKLEVKVLTQDPIKKVQTAYWRLAAGAIVPGHYHNSDEDCLVLDGDISFGDHFLGKGDFHQMKKGTTHPDMTTKNGALLYLKHDMHDDLSWLKV